MLSIVFFASKRPQRFSVTNLLSLVASLVPIVITMACGAASANNSSTLAKTQVLPLSISTQTLPSATVDNPYSAPLAATGGTPPYSWEISSGVLPNDFALASNVGGGF